MQQNFVLCCNFLADLRTRHPMEMEWASLLTCPTKSTDLKHHYNLGFKCLLPDTKWMKVWCLATMCKDCLSFSNRTTGSASRIHPKSLLWVFECSSAVSAGPALSQWLTSFSKLAAAEIILFSCSLSLEKFLPRQGARLEPSFSKDSWGHISCWA